MERHGNDMGSVNDNCFLTLPTNNYERVFEFFEVIIRNINSFSTSDTVKMAFSMTSTLHGDK